MKKAIMTVLLSGALCFLVNIPVLAEEQGMAVISEDNELGMLVAGEDSSFEQEEMSGEESYVIDDNDKEAVGQSAAFGESPAEILLEKIEDAGVAETGVDVEEPLGNSVNEADTAVHEGYEEAQIPASSELEQTASGMCIQKNEEDIEEKEAPLLKASVKKIAADSAAFTNTLESKEAVAAENIVKKDKADTTVNNDAESGGEETGNQTDPSESEKEKQDVVVSGEDLKVPAGFTGVAKDSDDGEWYYYKDGSRDLTYTGIANDSNGVGYRVKEGKVDFTYTGVAKRPETGKWCFLRDGILEMGYTGIGENRDIGEWFRVRNGVVDFSYYGVAKRPETGKWYFFRGGQLDKEYTGIGQNPDIREWFRVQNGAIDFGFYGVAKRPENNSWYFLRNGQLDWGYTGIGQNPDIRRWFRVQRGAVDFSYYGVAPRPENGNWYFMRGGELDWRYTGIAQNRENRNWYRVENGEVNWNYTGGALRPENGNWYYIKEGMLDWSYTGLDTAKDGKMQFYYKGCMLGSVEKTDVGLLYKAPVSNGKIVALDPGHSYVIPAGGEPLGPGSGAMKEKDTYGTIGWATGLKEADLNLAVATKLRTELLRRGYSVILTREDNNTAVSCVDRTKVANTIGADAYIRLHGNGDSSGKSGALMMCITAANTWQSAHFEDCNRLSQNVLDEYCAATGFNRIGVWNVDTLTGNNWAEVPTTLIEMGNMCNGSDDRWMAEEANQETMAIGIANGLDVFFDLRKTEGKEQASK